MCHQTIEKVQDGPLLKEICCEDPEVTDTRGALRRVQKKNQHSLCCGSHLEF